MAPKKQIHINFFEMALTGAHMGVGQWKTPGDNQHTKDTLEYYKWMAQLADKGKISCIFFADIYGVDSLFEGSAKASYETAASPGSLDPMVLVAGMASVTKNVSFGITGSTTYLNPYILARTVSTLDHITGGRFAWNIVTSFTDSAARAMGKTTATAHDRRYEEAHEYMDLVYSLWEGSFEDGAKVFDKERGIAYDYDKIHKVTFKGNFHNTDAWAPTHPSPQRTPVLFQAGASKAGSNFAAKHGEAIFCGSNKAETTGAFVRKMRALAASNGRNPDHIKFFPGITPIVAKTLEEAEKKYQIALANADYRGGLAKFSSYLGIDLSRFPLDEPLDTSLPEINGIRTMFELLLEDPNKAWTPRQIGQQMAFCGFGPMPVGTPEMVADVFEEWINDGDIDGFNVAYVSNPGSYEDFVELLVPVLQERGIMWKDYPFPGGTYRENLLGTRAIPVDHPAHQYSYSNLKNRDDVIVNENGDILIDRKGPKKEEESKTSVRVEVVKTMDDTKASESTGLVTVRA